MFLYIVAWASFRDVTSVRVMSGADFFTNIGLVVIKHKPRIQSIQGNVKRTKNSRCVKAAEQRQHEPGFLATNRSSEDPDKNCTRFLAHLGRRLTR